MGFTPLDLYRIGDASGPGLDQVIFGHDVVVYQISGQNWVKGSPQGGASTRSLTYRLKKPTSRWWHLPLGSHYPDTLTIRKDHGTHWLWEPSKDMLVSDYLRALTLMSRSFS